MTIMNEMPPVGHRVTKGQVWHIGKFNQQELLPQLPKPGGSQINQDWYSHKMEKLIQEIYFRPFTTIKPSKWVRTWNVLLLVGLEEAAKRDIAQTSSSIRYIRLGTDGTAENESQTGLITGTGNWKEYAVSGARSVASGTQTAKYSMIFLDTDGYALPVTLREGSQNTLNPGIAHSRVQFPDFLLSSGEAILTQINETLVNG